MRMPDRAAVECYSGHTFAQEPRTFLHRGQRRGVTLVCRLWREPSGPRFEVLADDGGTYCLVYHEAADAWQVRLRNRCSAVASDSVRDELQFRKEIEDDHRGTEGNQGQ
jgi:hypothetical protein